MNAMTRAVPARSIAANWMRRYELVGFFALTFLFSWAICLLATLWDL
jgi:hypothetical protein